MCQQDQTLLSHPCFSSNTCGNVVSSKITFAQGLMTSLEVTIACMMLCLSVTMFWFEAFWQPESIWIWLSGSWHKRRWTIGSTVEMGRFQSVKSTHSKFHDIPFLRYIDSCIAPKRIASCKIHGREQSLPLVVIIWVGISISKSVMLAHVSFEFVLDVL